MRAQQGSATALQLVAALWRYWITSAQLERGHALAAAALAVPNAQTTSPSQHALRCRALWVLGQLAFRMGRYAETLMHAEHSLAIARATADAEQTAAGLCLLAKAQHATGDTADALTH